MKEIEKIKKDKTYTYDEIKKIFDDGVIKTTIKPSFENDIPSVKVGGVLMMTSMMILSELEDNIFEKEEKING